MTQTKIKPQEKAPAGNKKPARSRTKAPRLTRAKAFLFLSREGVNPESTPVFMNFKYKSLLKELILKEMEDIMDAQNSLDGEGIIKGAAVYSHYIARMEALETLYAEMLK